MSRKTLSSVLKKIPRKILFVSPEITHLCKRGELADVSMTLPLELKKADCEIVLIQPLYSITAKNTCLKFEDLNLPFSVNLGAEQLDGRFFHSRLPNGLDVILVKNEFLFERKGIYGENNTDYPDNLDRAIFFCHAVLNYVRLSSFKPDIIHCNDWMTGLIPALLKTTFMDDSVFSGIKTVFTIHNLALQGNFDASLLVKTSLPWSSFNLHEMEFWGKFSLIKGGIVFSDALTTISETLQKKYLTPENGFGLHGTMATRKDRFWGIQNGVDYDIWSPEKDPFLKTTYSVDSYQKKKENKTALIKELKMKISPEMPLVAVIGSMNFYKDDDLLMPALDVFNQLDAGFIFSGEKNQKITDELISCSHKSKGSIVVVSENCDEEFIHNILGSVDILLLPSLFTPCNMLQLYALRYGTIPVVSSHCWLSEVMQVYHRNTGLGNGFMFEGNTACSMLAKLISTINSIRFEYHQTALIKNAMNVRIKWDKAIEKYLEVYRFVSSLPG